MIVPSFTLTGMLGLFEVLQAMPVPADPTNLLTAASKSATGQTQPEVLGHAPDVAMGPVACCSSRRVCSHAAISPSHAFTPRLSRG